MTDTPSGQQLDNRASQNVAGKIESLSVSYSDNIDQEPDGLKEEAIVTEITPSVQMRSDGNRFDAALNALTQFTPRSDSLPCLCTAA